MATRDLPFESAAAPRRAAAAPPAVGFWLLGCAFMVLAMAVIGAITRLTESGLSIMEWAPIAGTLPPLSQAEWERLFALYQQIPEYREENAGMTLAEFRGIFWWEYIHRLWGRLIGVVFALPFLWFLLRGQIPRSLLPHLLFAFCLGSLQGALGWYMVASGFAELNDVSQYRLAAHLSLAVAIYGYLLWLACSVFYGPRVERAAPAGLDRAVTGLLALLGLTLVSGAFVAGLNAGFTYNTFPLMDGDLVPEGYGQPGPWWLAVFEDVATVQFNHRLLAMTSLVAVWGLWLWARRLPLEPRQARALDLLGLMGVAQVALGISTLILAVPIWLGAIHQAGALVLIGLAVWALYLSRPPARSQPARA